MNKKFAEPRDIIDAICSGNSFTVMGDLIDDLKFTISSEWGGRKANMGETLKVRSDSDVRVADTPNETYPLDTDAPEGPGGPMLDSLAGNIPCEDDECPAHIGGVVDNDVEAWSDIWFYSNPVFVSVK